MKRNIRCERVYGDAQSTSGYRVLVDRLWPRGIKKEALQHDAWHKDVAPTTKLRKWYGHVLERWPEFKRRYIDELNANRPALEALLHEGRGDLVLLFASKDEVHNSAQVIREYLEEIQEELHPEKL